MFTRKPRAYLLNPSYPVAVVLWNYYRIRSKVNKQCRPCIYYVNCSCVRRAWLQLTMGLYCFASVHARRPLRQYPCMRKAAKILRGICEGKDPQYPTFKQGPHKAANHTPQFLFLHVWQVPERTCFTGDIMCCCRTLAKPTISLTRAWIASIWTAILKVIFSAYVSLLFANGVYHQTRKGLYVLGYSEW